MTAVRIIVADRVFIVWKESLDLQIRMDKAAFYDPHRDGPYEQVKVWN